MAASNDSTAMRDANLRRCRLHKWKSYKGLGFGLGQSSEPPHTIKTVESNSPAAAAGFRILDVILRVNQQDVSRYNFDQLKNFIKSSLENEETIEFLVVEKHKYDDLKSNNVSINRKYAELIEAPATMPNDYINFRKNTPRTCNIRLLGQDKTMGFETINGERDVGAFIQHITPDLPASRTPLRKSDRIIEIDDAFVDDIPYQQILGKIKAASKNNRSVKLYVVDTATYKYFKQNNISLRSQDHQQEDDDEEEEDLDYDHSRRDYESKAISPPTNIRLCTIKKNFPEQSYGMGVVYDPTERFHSLRITPSPNNEPSRAELAGVVNGDRLIEINGKNVQNLEDREVKQRISDVQYPDPLVLLVADATTADYYKRNGMIITEQLITNRRPTESRPAIQPGLSAMVIHNVMEPPKPKPSRPASTIQPKPSESTLAHIVPRPAPIDQPNPPMRLCTIRADPKFNELGFGLAQLPSRTGNDNGIYQIQQLNPNAPAAKANIHNGDYLIEVNGKNIENEDLQLLTRRIREIYSQDHKIRLLVIDRDGHKWYRDNNLNIDPLSPHANVTEHITPIPRPAPTPPVTTPKPAPPYQQPEGGAGTWGSVSSNRSIRTRTAVDVISGKFMLRLCNLEVSPGQSFGFQVAPDTKTHIIRDIQPNSPAAHAGLNPGDEIIAINDKYVIDSSYSEINNLITTATNNGSVRLLIKPKSFKPLTNRAKVSLLALNYHKSGMSSSTDDLLRSDRGQTNRPLSYTVNNFPDSLAAPTEPWPRKCVVARDPTFRGCGFQVIDKDMFDTPIVVEISPNSPAKRSGLAEGDHIIYIGDENVQNIGTFDQKVQLIQRLFDKNGDVALVTLTGSAYRVLEQRGGTLQSPTFDYQRKNVQEISPYLHELSMYNHENDFGLALYYESPTYIRQIERGSAADAHGIQRDTKILEIDGQDTSHLSAKQIQDIMKECRQKRKLNLLVIDIAGYEYMIQHALPINSLLPLVQKVQTKTISSNRQLNGTVRL